MRNGVNFLRTCSLREEQTVFYSTYRVMDYKVSFWFTHMDGGRNEQGCSYWYRIGPNGELAAAIVVGEESRILFWKWEKKIKFRSLFSITHRLVKTYRRFARGEV